MMSSGGTVYWGRKEAAESKGVKGIVVVFAWVSMPDKHLKNYLDFYSSLGWNSLVARADFLNIYYPERAMSLAFILLNELLEVLKIRTCPVVFVAFSGSPKACMYKVFQIIQETSEGRINPERQLIRNCVCGQIYDSGPVDFANDLNAQFALHPSIRKIPGPSKLVSWIAKGVAASLDGLYLTGFESQRAEYWQTLYSSVDLDAPYLILCSEKDDLAPYPVIRNFAQCLQDLGADIDIVNWNGSPHLEHYKHYPIQYRAAVAGFLEKATLVYSHRIRKLGEMNGMHDEISELIYGLQKAAVNSNQSFRRVALGPSDHFFLPSSAKYHNSKESGSLEDERSDQLVSLPVQPSINAHGVLGQILFDACVPKNIEGWDVRFSGSGKGQPASYARRHSPFLGIRFSSQRRQYPNTRSFLIANAIAVSPKQRTSSLKLVSHEKDKAQCNKRKRATHDGLYENAELKSVVMERALQIQANLSSEFPSLVKYMRPSHVTGGFWLGLSKHFCSNHLPEEDGIMVLEDEEGQEFETKYLADKDGLSGGWRGFSIAHKLLEGDICIFHLVTPSKFKVYIVRKSGSDEVDVALGLLKLESYTQQVDPGKLFLSFDNKLTWNEHNICENKISVGNTENRNGPILHNSTVDQSENERVELGSDVSDGVRLSESIVNFKEVKSFEDFNIVVNGLIIDSEFSKYLQMKYYELCCNQKSFLHENLLEGLNCKLVAGVIAETINIADAIRAAKLTTSHDSFLTWDKTLKSFEGLGMKVGFLCARLDQLMNLLTKSRRYKEAKLEQANANEEKQKLEGKLAEVTQTLSRLDREIESFEQENADDLEALFQKVANAPW
ncbi:hypothetical protein V6N13_128760 [Hibiscus sabdariffa]